MSAISAKPTKHSIFELGWLTGTWEGPYRNGQLEECFMRPNGGSLLGVSRIVINGQLVHREYLDFTEREDGRIVLKVTWPERTTAELVLGALREKEAVFDNLVGEMPSRLVYRLGEDLRLVVRVEGTYVSRPVHEEFRLERRSP